MILLVLGTLATLITVVVLFDRHPRASVAIICAIFFGLPLAIFAAHLPAFTLTVAAAVLVCWGLNKVLP